MRKILIVLTLILIFSVNIFSQKPLSKDADLEESKRWLKKNLVKKVADIYRVRFDGCQISITLNTPLAIGLLLPAGSVGGGFSHDEASQYLSGGPGTPFLGQSWKRKVTFYLNDLDISNIKIGKTWKKDQSLITLPAFSGQNSITLTEKQNSLIPTGKKKVTNKPSYEFRIKTEHAEKFAEAFRKASTQCSQ